MRMPVITRFEKNDRALSRRRIATLAATAVLAGGVQLLATDTAWACGESATTTHAKTTASVAEAPAADHQGSYQAGFIMTPGNQTITAGGPKVEVGVSVTNFTGAPYQNISALLGIYNPAAGGLEAKDVTVEVASAGGWKPVKLVHGGCDPSLYSVASPATTTPRLENGRAANFLFRVGLSAKAPREMTSLVFVASAGAPGFPEKGGESRDFRVVHTTAPAPSAKPTTPAKPKPTPTRTAKATEPAEPAEPVADRTKDAVPAVPAAEAPKANAPAPATTAPAGTPELAQTGSSSTNTFLAVSSAALLALGAGVLIAVRRLRRQH
ncbi:LPXTG cell wall anchor domain-containing protein [Streptomyces sp. LS1784]|uniref:LPXTG cell wall anchor domain-containing protein n=1 Tax=Streptomyces sp. LS1784 TaxID=2851533 RepID=UPI001CCFD5D5|nr:LPXTG cell wall anchor domain-containing protein [Streptomyces sp. LS1784]